MMFNFTNLEIAYCKVRKGKTEKPNHIRYNYFLERNLWTLSESLNDKTYKPSKLRTKTILYPKRRIAKVPNINDKIIQHAICDDYIYPKMEQISVKESSACIKGRGATYSSDLLKEQLHKYYRKNKTNHFYVLKCDIHGYFAHIGHDRLKNVLDKYIDDEDALFWAKKYVDLEDIPNGIPLGLQQSHINSNFYLNDMDYMIKYKYRAKYYGRYKDDFYIISSSKKSLEKMKDILEEYLHSINLTFNPKTAILENNFDFLGFNYRLTTSGKVIMRLAKPKLKQHRKRIRKLLKQLKANEIEPQKIGNYHQGWRTHASQGDCGALIRSEDKWLSDELEKLGYRMIFKQAKKKPKRKHKNDIVIIERIDNNDKNSK